MLEFLTTTGTNGIVTDLVLNNFLLMGLIAAISYGVAKVTPWKIDELLVEAIWGPIRDLIGSIRKTKGE